MNRTELVAAVAHETGLDPATVDHALNGIADQVCEAMVDGHVLTIRGFGRFETRRRAATKRVHPGTGVPVEVPASVTVTFTPSQSLKERINP